MLETLTYIESHGTDPYRNLALEEFLLFGCKEKECILYLWQNEKTVVIGKNQNAWKECRTEQLEWDGGHLARRLSGGGAVYHDLGNLNFTFLVSREHYDVKRQLSVIARALEHLGLHIEASGRNDLLIDGKKFSGNAFYRHGDHCYHHGTIMLDVDKEKLGSYLTVSREKLKSKGVDSVRSRVANLRTYLPELTIADLKQALRRAFGEVYGLPVQERTIEDQEKKEIESRARYFGSWDWLYGRRIPFQHEITRKFPWGEVTIQLQVENGKIKETAVYSDALKTGLIEVLPNYLKGVRFSSRSICIELGLYWSEDPEEEQMMNDLIEWMKEEEW
nr:lipoate--protein ligase [uncultured Sellimonas sp.]